MSRKPRIAKASPRPNLDSSGKVALQHDKRVTRVSFEDAANAAGCDLDEARFNEALRKIARHKPKPDKPPEKAPETEDKKPAE
jgi:hypothetical protein